MKRTHSCPARETDWFGSAASRRLNQLLGATDCDSVSQTTADGLHTLTNNRLSNPNALHLVHAGMLSSILLVLLNNKQLRILGVFLIIALLLLYVDGRSQDEY